jgi:serine protease AprX
MMREPNGERPVRDAAEISRSHVDHVLRARRQETERLSFEWGREVVDKPHPWVVGDLIHARKEEDLLRLLEVEEGPETERYPVMVNLTTGRGTEARLPPRGPQQRRAAASRLQQRAAMPLARLEEDIRNRGAEVEESFWLTHSVTTTLSRDQLEAIAARKDVASVTTLKREIVVALNTSRTLIQADQVHAAGNTGAGMTVAIIDTGVDSTHPALAAVLVGAQQDMTGTAVNPDDNGHGTHCAGIVASQDGTFIGIAPGAQLLDIRIMDGIGASQTNWATAGLQAAVNSGAQVASNSWGWSHADGAWVDPDGNCVLCQAADNAVAAGVVVVVAAGNEDNDSCSTYDTHIRCPGLARSVITVGASDDSDNMAGFSSIGPTPDGRTKPDVTAPGVEIASCQAAGTALGSVVAPGFINLDGTSMACPHVAGVSALILSKNGTQTPANVKSLIMSTAVNIGASANEMGSGRVDALAAVNSTPSPP